MNQQQQIVLSYIPLALKMARTKSLSAPPCISFEELESAAYMGLVKAAKRFDPQKGIEFSSYARIRIDGEMKDYMRFSGRERVRNMIEGEDFEERPCTKSCEIDTSCLSPREAKILQLYYIEGRQMKDIGMSEGIGESRVSQILGSCRKKLKRNLKGQT